MKTNKEIQNIKLKVLVLEDSFRDMELISELLTDAGYLLEMTHTEDKQGFVAAINNSNYDIILSDFKLPGFDAFGALEISKKACPEVPFICVSGSVGEETAIELLKRGAVDYVMKDRLERLPFAVKRALDESVEKTAYLKASNDLIISETRFRQVAETAQEWIWEVDKNGLYTYTSPVVQSLLGYLPDELVGRKYFFDSFVPDKKEELKNAAFDVFSRKLTFRNFENPNLHKDGHLVILSTSGSPIFGNNGDLVGYRGVDEDITERKRAEKALKESEKKFRKLFQNHAAVKLIIDPENGSIIDANDAAVEFYGWPLEELQKMNIVQINSLSPDLLQKEMENARNQKKVHFEFKHRRADGDLVDVEVFSSSIKIAGKQYLHSIIHDISERKKAEEKIKLLNQAIESSSVSVVITDRDGNIEYVNPFGVKATGYSLNELTGKNPRVLKSGNQTVEFYQNLWNTILAGKNWEGEFQNKRKNGELYWEKAVISPILNSEGEITNFVAIKEDITERKKILEELVAAKERAVESDKLKSAFLANMSHEIRTPMNGILGFAELLKEPDLTGEQQQYFISIIEKSGARMLNIINNIVDISKIESGQMKLEYKEINLNEQIEYIYNFFKPEVEARGIQFLYRTDLPVSNAYIKTDSEKIYAVLTNLVKNAIKYTNKGTIEFGYILKNEPKTDKTGFDYLLEFYVKDTGIGIPKDRQKAIFERFIQADITDKMALQGAGLGLAISKAYIEMLGSEIRVESDPGKGSTFYFTLPFFPFPDKNNNTTGIENQKHPNLAQIKDLKILIAEDDESSRELLSIEIGKFCKEILFAGTGTEAVDMCRNNPDIDLIFMDIKMPEMSGYRATRQIRQFNTGVLIIAVTAFALTGDKKMAFEAGCTDYISKPFSKIELLGLIQKYLGNKL